MKETLSRKQIRILTDEEYEKRIKEDPESEIPTDGSAGDLPTGTSSLGPKVDPSNDMLGPKMVPNDDLPGPYGYNIMMTPINNVLGVKMTPNKSLVSVKMTPTKSLFSVRQVIVLSYRSIIT